MLDEAAFLGTIRDHPEEDAPRLVYADWLEEHGHLERAELIRVQVERARLSAGDPRLIPLGRREQELLQGHLALLFPDRDAELGHGWRIRRGLIDRYDGPAAIFLSHRRQFETSWPVYEVELSDATANILQELITWPSFGQLRSLEMYRAGLNVEDLRDFLDSPYIDNLTALKLGQNDLGPRGAQLLASTYRMPRLRVLDVRHNQIGSEGVRAFATLPAFPQLEDLSLCGNVFPVEDVLQLLDSPHRQALRKLDLWYTNLQDEGLSQLVKHPGFARLTDINLNNNGLSEFGIDELLAVPFSTSLNAIALGYSSIQVRQIDALLSSPRFPALKQVSLLGCSEFSRDELDGLKQRWGERIVSI